MEIDRLAADIFRFLRRMDGEAAPRADGTLTGLSWYGGHARPDRKRPRTEPEWSRRLRALLEEVSHPARCEVPYPARAGGPARRCDLVIEAPDGHRLWLEVKGAWKAWWAGHGGLRTYRSWLLEPLAPDARTGKSHSAALDFAKLAGLGPPEADSVGLLLVGFDTPDAPMAPDVEELTERARLGVPPWRTFADHWPDPHAPPQWTHAWLWWRPARDDPGVRETLRPPDPALS